MMRSSISRNSIMLGLFAVLTTALIAGTYLGTRDKIIESQRKAQEKALLQIIPDQRHDNSMLDDTYPVTEAAEGLGLTSEQQVFIARQDGAVVAVIVPVTAPDGYSGAIDLIVGINSDGTIAGVRTLTHKETPGLGDKVDLKKSDWILSFNGTSLRSPKPEQWAVKKDNGYFDQFTGATITPRAVTAAIKRSLQYFEINKALLLAPAIAAPVSEENNNG